MNDGNVDAVVLAAGRAARMHGQDKTLALLGGVPVLVWCLRTFDRSDVIREVVVTASRENRDDVVEAVRAAELVKVSEVVLGGASRAESVLNALESLADNDSTFVAIHDGARPFVTTDIISRGVQAARIYGASVAAVPSVDTVKLVDGTGLVSKTIPRKQVWLAQTPQVGRLDILLEAHRRNRNRLATFTDDVALLEHEGIPVHVFESDPRNVKITCPNDLFEARERVAFLADRAVPSAQNVHTDILEA